MFPNMMILADVTYTAVAIKWNQSEQGVQVPYRLLLNEMTNNPQKRAPLNHYTDKSGSILELDLMNYHPRCTANDSNLGYVYDPREISSTFSTSNTMKVYAIIGKYHYYLKIL